jgi:predicted DsbA family dithiol-disulfide isomerase
MKTAQFWFDPICPWTYVTYQWLDEARAARGFNVTPRLLSLHFLNQGRPDTGHAASHRASLDLERFLAWVRNEDGDDAMERAYRSLAEALFLENAKPDTELVRQTASGLDVNVEAATAAAGDSSWDVVILEDHHAAMTLVGDDVGSPVIALEDGTAFFGPVLARAPRGEDAGRLWDGCVALASCPDFFELKRSRGEASIRFD